jgi:hypothetical protein
MPSFQVVSDSQVPPMLMLPSAFTDAGCATSCVPPTAVTCGSVAGVLAAFMYAELSHVGRAAPWSPDDASSVMFSAASCAKTLCCAASRSLPMHASASP